MKKKIVSSILCAAAVAAVLSGCGYHNGGINFDANANVNVNGNEIINTNDGNTTPAPTAAPADGDGDAEAYSDQEKAEDAYNDFLNNGRKVKTSKKYKEDDADGNYDGLLYGEYSIDEMREAFENLEGIGNTVKYVIMDLGEDGANELVLYFEADNSGYFSHMCYIYHDCGELILGSDTSDGNRSYGKLYDTGYLERGVASGGLGSYAIYSISSEGETEIVMSINSYSGFEAANVAYYLDVDDREALFDEFDSLIKDANEFFIYVYNDNGEVYVSVEEFDTTESKKQSEEEFIKALEDNGVHVISSMEMAEMTDTSEYRTKEVNWKILYESESAGSSTGTGDSDYSAIEGEWVLYYIEEEGTGLYAYETDLYEYYRFYDDMTADYMEVLDGDVVEEVSGLEVTMSEDGGYEIDYKKSKVRQLVNISGFNEDGYLEITRTSWEGNMPWGYYALFSPMEPN
ncbi:MAG: hypothetical protein K6A72_03105 [Lachnospiraceae bacterium]|nr:hypothetical protein [Lachnospiraceae bacterium]